MDSSNHSIYVQAEAIAREIEAELKRLGRWQSQPLPPEKLENIGAFGSSTMTFFQWLQFVLLPRILDIVKEQGDFPVESHIGSYAVRELDGDPDSGNLLQLLHDLDTVINGLAKRSHSGGKWVAGEVWIEERLKEVPFVEERAVSETVSIGDTTIPPVLLTLAALLPQFEGQDLESQLQTFDSFLAILSPDVRLMLRDLLKQVAQKTANPASRLRIEQAAESIGKGERAAAPYDHEAAMKKYREEHKKSYPKGKE